MDPASEGEGVKRGAEDLMIDSDVIGEGKRKREGEELERLREENDRLSAENTKLRIELEEMRRNVDGLRNGVTAAERCGCCLALESKAKRYARDNRDLTLGEQVIRNPLIRDQTLKHLNPFKLSDLQHVLNMRQYYKLLPDVDLKECYFEGAWQFQKDEFPLADWREMSVEEMKRKVRNSHPEIDYRRIYPPGKVDVDTLNAKEEIVRAFWELTYVPWRVYKTAVAGAHVLRWVETGRVGRNRKVTGNYLCWACRAGLDADVIDCLAYNSRKRDINEAAWKAASGGHTDVVDLLHDEFGARVDQDCVCEASRWGHDAMIDHLVEEYGVDPDEVDEYGWTALHDAARHGRVSTVKLLVEKHNVDIHKRDERDRWTALDWSLGGACAAVLRGYGATRDSETRDSETRDSETRDSETNDSDVDSDDNSDTVPVQTDQTGTHQTRPDQSTTSV